MDPHHFRRYLAALRGDAAPGLSWASLAVWAERNPERFELAVQSLTTDALPQGAVEDLVLQPPPEGEDYERWGEAKRRRANLNALVALRQQQARGTPPELAERRAMEAYTGWGGFRDIEDLPPDPRIFPGLYVQGIKAWRRAKEKQALPTGPGADLFRGLRQQYFTSLPVAEGMWRLGCRVAPFPVRDALEPSAGVGRLLRVAQDTAIRWTAVEMDPLLAEFLRALFPGVDVREMPFETFAREAAKAMTPGAGWDLVVANPPFPERPTADRALDPKFDGWKNADAYFAVRSSTLLRAGGTLVFLTPMANMVGSSGKELRTALMKRCHFSGAVFPPQNIFPNISTQLVLHVWVRRAEDRSVFTPHEQQILDGRYLELPEAQTNTLGTWVKQSGPHGEVDVVQGAFDPRAMEYVQLYPLSAEELEQIRGARGVQAAAPAVPSRRSGPKAAPAEALPQILVEARSLTDRVQEFTRRLGHGGADAAIAEAGREELKTDLLDFYAHYGAPGLLREVKADRKRYAPLVAALGDDGRLSDDVVQARGLAVLGAPPPDSTPQRVVEFFSRQNGVCSDYDLSSYFTYDVGPALLADPEIAVELREDGTRWWYRLVDYLTGDLYARLALVEGTLTDVESPLWQTKLEDQRAALLAAVREKDLTDLDVTPRSGFVSPECLTAWIVETIYQAEVANAEIARGDRALREKDPFRGVPANVVRRPIVAIVENGRLELTGVPDNLSEPDIRWLAFVLAFWNRSLRVEDPTGGGTRMDAFKRDQATPEERMAAEDQLVTQFKAWLSQSEWGPRVVAAYNRAYSGFRLREYDSGPMAIARLGPHPRGFELHAYQNASVRRLVDRGSGVLALDVGLGKCQRGDTWVLTDRGMVRLEQLFPNECTLTPGVEETLPPPAVRVFTGKRWTGIRSLFRQRLPDAESTLRIETERGGGSEVTARHPYPVIRNGVIEWVRAVDLQVGDFLAVPARVPEPLHPASPPDARLLRLFMWQLSEGNEDGGTSNRARITQDNIPFLESLKADYVALFGEKVTSYGLPTARIEDLERVPTLVISDPDYRAKMQELGFPWGTLSAGRRFPEWFLGLSNQDLRQSAQDFFDAEGTITEAGAIELTLAARELVEQLQYLLLRFGVRTSFSETWKRATNGSKVKRPYYRITACGEDLRAFHREIGFATPWKAERLAVVAARPENPNTGIPVAHVLAELEAVGVTFRMLMGRMATATLQTVARSTAEELVESMRRLATPSEEARFVDLAARKGFVGRNSMRTLAAIRAGRGLLLSGAARIEALIRCGHRFERVESVSLGSVGGLVYDLHVDEDAYDDQSYVSGRGGLIAHNTGTLLASIAAMRQSGKARRPLVVVPNSVLGKWAKEAKEWLPSYRIGVIGISTGRHGVRSDTPEERAEKWNRLAQGAYELCLCTQQNFLDDVALSDERTADLVSQMFWLQRDLGLSLAEKKLVERRIEEAGQKIRSLALARDRFQDELNTYGENKVPHRWNARIGYGKDFGWIVAETKEKLAELEKKIQGVEASIQKWREQLAEPTSTEIEKARQVAEGFMTERPFRPLKDRPLVDWTSLGVDLLGVDEAHAYKNIWKPSNRYGKSIKYMGGMEQKASKGKGRKGDEEEDDTSEEDEAFGKMRGRRTIRAWDMFLKTQDLLDRQEDRGVVLLTATPVTNSPMEVYNLLSLVSRRVWQSRQVRSKEEFVDRYCRFSEQLIADGITGEVRYQLAMTEFTGLDELRGIMSAYIEYRTTADVLAWQERVGIPPERRLRVPVDVPHQETLPVDPVQADIYQRLRAHVINEQQRLREAKAPPKEISALNLVLSDLLSKAALDPRLLIEDIKEIQRQIPKTKDPAAAERLTRRAWILTESGAAEASFRYQSSGAVPEKYMALARNIASRPGAGHIVFVDYKMAHEEIIRVLTTYAGIPRSRIVTLTGDDDKADRLEIASGLLVRNADGSIKSNSGGFNGRDPVVQGEGTPEEVVFDPGADPSYDVIIGTSGAMSEGIDLQRRTAAVHHLNYSWVPSVIQQRNGRAVRQGNRFGTVNLWYYLSERTIDVVRLSVTWGKGNWLESLFGEAQSIANPAASIGSDVEEAIAEMFAPNPEAARAELQRVRQERETEHTKKQRERAQARWISLVAQYEQARGIKDPMAQAVKLSLADHAAAALRALPQTVFPQSGLLAQARRERVFYDLETGIHFAVGGRFVLRLYGLSKFEPLEGLIEILDFRVTMGRDSVAMWFAFRSFGHLETHFSTTLRGLLAPRIKELGRVNRGTPEEIPTEGGTLEQLPAVWSTEQELKDLTLYVDSPRQLPKSLLSVGAEVWAKYVEQGWGGSSGSRRWIPLRTSRAPGEVWLYMAETLYALKKSDYWKDLIPLYGADERSWRLLCGAIRNNRLRTYYVLQEGLDRGPVTEKFGRFDMASKPNDAWSDRGRLQEMSRQWFGRVPPEALFVEGQRHEPPGPLKPSTGVAF